MSNTVEGKLVRLAYRNEKLRPHILPFMPKKTAGRLVAHLESQKKLIKIWAKLDGAQDLANPLKRDLKRTYEDLQSAYINAGKAAQKADPGNPYAEDDFFDSDEGQKFDAEVAYVAKASILADELQKFLSNLEQQFWELEAIR